ncbi:MAG: ATP-binding domain-containing protein, partial [Candidatus Sungbacteria bacterium]|nr:ATP-binding domain-containing protein [Candidatus Sungbacteria bacterium]
RNILNFEKDFPEARVIVLDENYRSTQTILEGANAVISRNIFQKPKLLWTQNSAGEKIECVILPTGEGEAECVSGEIVRLIGEGRPREDIAVLYRTNAQSRGIEESLLSKNIPYTLIGGTKFYQRKEVKDIVGYLRVIINPNDRLAIKRIINIPPRGIGAITFLKYLESLEGKTPSQTGKGGEQTRAFEQCIQELRTDAEMLSPSLLIRTVIKKIKYEEYLEDAFLDAESRIENLRELENLAARFNGENTAEELSRMLEEISLASDADEAEKKDKKGITLMTLHAAKGLEFPIVFIVGMEEGLFPHSKSLFDPASLEEERRLCYVGLTRAKEKVWLTRAYRRRVWGDHQINSPSRFLKEIPEHLLNITDTAGAVEFLKGNDDEYEDDELPFE